MSEPNLDESTLVTLLDLALAEYAYRADGGEPVDREAFVAEYAEKLRACLAASDQVEQHAARGEPHVDPLRDGRTLPPDDVSRVAAPETVAYRDASTPALPLGAKVRYFGDYELLEEIARGGMGVVYKARQTRLNRIVALKMILAGQLASADDVKRFHTEAEAAANLQHPNIVAIHEVGEHEGQHYFSMDYVEGRSLADLARANPPSARQAAEYVGSIAQAIQYAHEQGTLHRDLKPANVLIDRHGQPRVTDFGLARRIEGGSELTGTGQILGTPSYMPPEQAAGNRGEVGPASDVYSLGAILYELVAGRPPFRAETPLDTLLQVLEQEPAAPRLLNPKLRRDLETICLKCLRKEPGKRYGSAGELAADLGRFLAGEPILARRVGVGERAVKWAKRRPAVAAMIGVTVVAIFGSGIAVKLTRTAAAKRQTETEQAAAKRQAETELSASRARAQTAVEAMLTAPAAAVPYTLANLQSLREFSLPLLRQRLNDPQADRVQRLHAAYALADLGETPQGPLLDAIVTAPAGECINLVVALAHVKEAALPELTRRAESAEENTDKARCAIVALHLGDPQPAINALAVRGDPVHRTTLIHAYANWHGKLSAELFDNDDAAYRSGLCAAVGRIAPEALEPGEREAATQALTELYLHDPEGGTHAAADWALRQWKHTVPGIEPTSRPPSDRRWFINRQGMTLVEVPPAGKFTMETVGQGIGNNFTAREVKLTKAFMLADREVTVEQFRRFIDDPDYPASEKPDRWQGEDAQYSPTPDCPVQNVDWFDAVLYCNWLSAREGLRVCYVRTGYKKKIIDFHNKEHDGDVWRCDFSADGYRLPVEAEWEYACRAGSSQDFGFGSDEELLPQYAWFALNGKSRAWPVGVKLPNALGVFDMHGNVSEWCSAVANVEDPTGPYPAFGGVVRGGAFIAIALYCRCASRIGGSVPVYRNVHSGFRVCCGR